MALPRLLILCAVMSEARALARAFSLPGKLAGGVEGNEEVTVVVIGIRGVKVERARPFLAGTPVRVVLAGLGGGLDPGLTVGDVVVEWGEGLGSPPTALAGACAGRIYTAEGVVGSVAEKAEVFARTGARVVEMEGAVVRAFLKRNGVEGMVQVRGISDGAGDVLDAALLGVVDEEGRPRAGKVAGMLLRKPGAVKSLMKLKKACDLALANVGNVVRQIALARWEETARCRGDSEGVEALRKQT